MKKNLIDKLIFLVFVINFTILVFIFDKRIFEGFSIPKVFCLYTGVMVLSILYIIRLIKIGDFKFPKTLFNLPLLIFLIVTIISSILALNLPLALIGSYGRLDGLFSFLSYMMMFFIVIKLCTYNRKNSNRIGQLIVVIACILAFYGIIQYYTAKEESWAKAVFAGRVVATLGNPVFLGLFLVLAYPLACIYYLITPAKKSWYYGIAAILIFWCLYLTLSRGCMIAWLGLSLFFLITIGKKILKNNLKKLGLVYSGCFLIILFYSFNPPVSYITRAKDLVQVKEDGGGIELGDPWQSRFYMWQGCYKIIKDYPIFGIGLDNLGLIFSKYKPKGYFKLKGQYTTADRAHNLIVELCITRGLTGLLVFLWLAVSIFLLVFRLKNLKHKERIILAGYLSCIVGYLIQNQFNFPETTTYTLFFIVLGLLAISADVKYKPVLIKSKLRYAMVIIVPFFIFLFILAIKLYIADFHFKQGIISASEGNLSKTVAYYKRAIAINPYVRRYYGSLSEFLIKEVKTEEALKEAINYTKKASFIFPTDSIFYNLSGMAHYLLFEKYQEKLSLAQKAIKLYKKAISWDKYFIDAYNNLGAVYLKLAKQDKDLNIIKLRQALRMFEKAIQLEEEAFKLKPSLNRMLVTAEHYLQLKDLKKAEYFYKKILKYYPKNLKAYINLGYIYYENKDYKKSKEMFKQILNLEPSNEYAKNMLYLLNSKTLY
jgi:tetratricopeptide (TPR) repeat protein/O-antigen ligase